MNHPATLSRALSLILGKDIVREANCISSSQKEPIEIEDLWIDIPSVNTGGAIHDCHVLLHDNTTKRLTTLFPMGNVLNTYGEHKWQAHVFCASRDGVPELVNKAAIAVIEDYCGIEIRGLCDDEL